MKGSEELISIDAVFAPLRDGGDPALPCWRAMAELLDLALPAGVNDTVPVTCWAE